MLQTKRLHQILNDSIFQYLKKNCTNFPQMLNVKGRDKRWIRMRVRMADEKIRMGDKTRMRKYGWGIKRG